MRVPLLMLLLALTLASPAEARRKHRRRRHDHGRRAAQVAAHPDTSGPTQRGVVREVRGELVYVALGLADGIKPGATLRTGAARGALLEVIHVGERQLVARRKGPGRVRPGDPVPAPGSSGEPARPVKTLPPPAPVAPDAARALWELPRRRGWSKVVHRGEGGLVARARERRRVRRRLRGSFTASYAGVIDTADRPLDLHLLRLRSRLEAQVSERLDWAHDVAARLDLGPRLAERRGAASRPYYELRQARLRYRAGTWRDGRPGAGALEARVGRLWMADAATAGLVDGAAGRVGLGDGLALGLHGGLAPRLLDTGLSTDLAVGGAEATWSHRGEAWRATARVTAAGSLLRGQTNRADVAVGGTLAHEADLYLAGRVVTTAVPAAAELGGGPTLALSHAYLGVSYAPSPLLRLDAHYAHDRELVDRELWEAVGGRGVVLGPRETAWLRASLRASRHLSATLSGSLGFGAANATLYGGAARVHLRRLTAAHLRVALGYRYGQSRDVRTQNASVDLGVEVTRGLDLGVAYDFTTFQTLLLDERQDEHAVEARADLWSLGPWRLNLTVGWVGGDLPSHLRLFALTSWRFP